MIYKANQETIDTYFSNKESISNTLLKSFVNGYNYYLLTKREMEEGRISSKYYDEPKDHFLIGSAVDMKLTHEDSDFNKNYYISTLSEKPSDTEISIIKHVYDNRIRQIPLGQGITPVTMGNLLDHVQLLEIAFQFHNYQPRYGFDAKKKAFDNIKITTYWNELLASANRQILTLEDMILINSLVNFFKMSSFTSFLFNQFRNDIDIFYQVPVYISRYKILIDIVVVDHLSKNIILYDIKTMQDDVLSFPNDVKKRRYDIQAGFYYHVSCMNNSLKETLKCNYNLTTSLKTAINNYNIDDFRFVVASKSFPNSKPVIYSIGKEKLNEFIEGRQLSYTHSIDVSGNIIDKIIPKTVGIKELINLLLQSVDVNYDYRYGNDGIIKLFEN